MARGHFGSMKLLTVAAAVVLLPAAAVAVVAKGSATSSCDCGSSLAADMAAFGVSALQTGEEAKRPRDCTCITGVKTYQTTPRDELLGMGMKALHGHLASCERKLDGLEEQKEYAVADSEVKVKTANEQMKDSKESLDHSKNGMAADRSEDKEEKNKIMKSIGALEIEVTDLNGQYNTQFSAWWKLKDDMTAEVAKMKNCNCKSASFLQRLRGAPATPDMYDTAHKVEECETKVIKVSGEITAAQAAGRKATILAIEDRKNIGRSMADQQHMHKLLSTKGQVEDLTKTKSALEKITETRKATVAKYKKTNADIKMSLLKLDKEMKTCGCA